MVRNKRAAPTAPPPAAAPSPPLIQTLPWGSDRRKTRAPLPPTAGKESPTMPTSVEKAGGVLPPPSSGQATARFCLGPYERRGGGATSDAADGGSLGVDSEGSSTDVGVCLDDSASDVSQESLVTSDSAVSSPPARRVGRRSPGVESNGSSMTAPTTKTKDIKVNDTFEAQHVSGKVKKTQTVSINSVSSPKEENTSQVISVNSEPVKDVTLETSTVQVVSTSPAPPKAVSVVELNSHDNLTSESPTIAVTSQTPSQLISVESKVPASQGVEVSKTAVAGERATSQIVSVSPKPGSPSPRVCSTKRNSPSPTVSRAATQGSSTVFLSPEQPSGVDSLTVKTSVTPPPKTPESPSPVTSPAPSTSATSQSSTSSVFLSPSQPDSESTPSPSASGVVPQDNKDEQPTSKSAVPPSPETPAIQETPQKTKAPQPPRKSPAPQPPATPSSPSSVPPPSPGLAPISSTLRQSPAPASLRQLSAPAPAPPPPPPAVQTRTFAERQRRPRATPLPPVAEHGFQFHLKESIPEGDPGVTVDGFAGVRDYLSPTAPIHSSRGTVRGVKDRVRAGIATFLQDNSTAKALKSREQGRLVVYVTSMSIVRPTFQQCQRVRQILRQLLAEFEERDLFLSVDHQQELQRRLGAERVIPPQVFIDGNLVGGAEAVERLNESGELRRMLKPFKMAGPRSSCGKCGGFRMLPCTSCNGSKKSCHRNHFTEQWVVLRCGTCDQSGLMRCDLCRS